MNLYLGICELGLRVMVVLLVYMALVWLEDGIQISYVNGKFTGHNERRESRTPTCYLLVNDLHMHASKNGSLGDADFKSEVKMEGMKGKREQEQALCGRFYPTVFADFMDIDQNWTNTFNATSILWQCELCGQGTYCVSYQSRYKTDDPQEETTWSSAGSKFHLFWRSRNSIISTDCIPDFGGSREFGVAGDRTGIHNQGDP